MELALCAVLYYYESDGPSWSLWYRSVVVHKEIAEHTRILQLPARSRAAQYLLRQMPQSDVSQSLLVVEAPLETENKAKAAAHWAVAAMVVAE